MAAQKHPRFDLQEESEHSSWITNSFSSLLLGQVSCCAQSDTAQGQIVIPMRSPRSRGRGLRQQGIIDAIQANLIGMDVDSQGEADKVGKSIMQEFKGSNPLRLQLLSAIKADDAPGVLQHVADGADVPLMGEALRLAAHRGSAAVVRELVAVGLCVNASCPHTEFTPLQLACAGGHHVVCEVLLDALADVHKPIGNVTPLNMARRSGHAEVEEVLARHITTMVMNEGDATDAQSANRRAHVLPRVSPFLSEAVLQAMPSNIQDDGTFVLHHPIDEIKGHPSKQGPPSSLNVIGDYALASPPENQSPTEIEPSVCSRATILDADAEALEKNRVAMEHL
jgi:hypothetical protein|eukprot:TRINITY_DN68118_c0_g1_i1.p1 TRINITY_DN68118_c0_g1~~TRINITY_DN68118_c0_g1_i1.p1  ORF type:complete len:372 (-),score=58.53 TRINITY_DN68118_c0_g1_i1:197-1210(-)